jgi:hypothetical protein
MYLFQILLPLYGNDGRRIARTTFQSAAEELARDFGGLTAYFRAPARGLWRQRGGRLKRDDIVVYEVTAKALQRRAWQARRSRLQRAFRQEQIVVRAVRLQQI